MIFITTLFLLQHLRVLRCVSLCDLEATVCDGGPEVSYLVVAAI